MEHVLKAITENSHELYNKIPSILEMPYVDKSFIKDVVWEDLTIDTNEKYPGATIFQLMQERAMWALRTFPANTLQRKHLQKVSIKNTHWFQKGAAHDNLSDALLFPHGPLTANKDEAASEYSLPWGFSSLIDGNPYNYGLILYDCIDDSLASHRYFHYTCFHEFGHVYGDAAFYSLYHAKNFLGLDNIADKRNAYTLSLPNGEQVSGNEYVSSFAALAEKYGPFGSYTAGYEKQNGEELWLRESFADATAAFFIGYMMFPEKNFAPLHPEVKNYMYDFYHAVATITR